ncbi:MAG TPA: hypothetical protein VF718_09130 [Allosphingosinicella sp.]|jgi:hypothetical protein
MRMRMLLGALAAAAAASAGKGEACVISFTAQEVGPKRTPEEVAADRERARRETLRRRTRAAQRELAGGADAASGLADMLVPNIQAISIESSSCGVGEIDWAGSAGMRYEPLAGTAYAGREAEFHPIVSDHGPGSLGPPCNAEFRVRFAEHLRRRLAPAELRRSFVFLAARRRADVIERLMAFHGRTRLPPVDWAADPGIVDWARRHPSGRALSAAVAGFWRESGPLLASAELSCPSAFAAWKRERDDLVERIARTIERPPAKP